MKRKIVLFLALSLATALVCVGCGSEKETMKNEADVVTTETETESETVEPTEETETEEVTEPTDETETEVAEPTETETEEPTETEVADTQTAPEYTYTDMSATKYAQKSVNVRDLPNTDGAKLGALSVNQEVKVTGQCNETSWYRIEYKGSVAYVSNNYLGDNKVEEKKPEPAPENTQTAENTPAPNSEPAQTAECPYTLYEVIDEGGNNVYYYYLVGVNNDEINAKNWAAADTCVDIIRQRMADAGYPDTNICNSGDEPTPYYVNGVRVHRAIIYVGQKNSDGTIVWNTDVL